MTGMSRSAEAAQGEAIRTLASQLEAWGVDDALARAHEVIRGLVMDGWRPRAPRCELTVPDPGPGERVTADRSPEYLAAKAALRGGGAS